MTNNAFLLDLGKCIGCQACVAACKIGNELPQDTQYIHIGEKSSGSYPQVEMRIKNQRCYHCLDAACVAVCPTGALFKENGLTRVNDEICSACGYCLTACPFSIPQLIDGHIHKCDGCADVVKAGGTPWCVKTCPNGALMYGERPEILAEANRRLINLQKRYPNARIYGESESGGLGLIIILPDEPEQYDLPSHPQISGLTGGWQNVAQPASLGLTSLSIIATGLAAIIARRNHMKEVEREHIKAQAQAAGDEPLISEPSAPIEEATDEQRA
jgi:formate dehydrogenase iron-sulfur subunit